MNPTNDSHQWHAPVRKLNKLIASGPYVRSQLRRMQITQTDKHTYIHTTMEYPYYCIEQMHSRTVCSLPHVSNARQVPVIYHRQQVSQKLTVISCTVRCNNKYRKQVFCIRTKGWDTLAVGHRSIAY